MLYILSIFVVFECVRSDQMMLLSFSELMEMRHFIVIFPFVCLFVCLAFLRFVLPRHGLLGDHIKSLF